MSGLMSLLGRMGARYHTKEGKRWWPARTILWLGFEVDTHNNVVRMEERKVEEGLRLREGIFEPVPGASMQARGLLAAVSFLNFLQWVAPGGFCHPRSGWNAANESGAVDLWRHGARRAVADAVIT